MACRGLRGATVATENTRAAILGATYALLAEMISANGMNGADVISAIFSVTPDLTAVYPAEAARQLGWTDAALLCVQEMAVLGSLTRCIRVLVHWETARPAGALIHVYLNGAEALRPDWAARERPGL